MPDQMDCAHTLAASSASAPHICRAKYVGEPAALGLLVLAIVGAAIVSAIALRFAR